MPRYRTSCVAMPAPAKSANIGPLHYLALCVTTVSICYITTSCKILPITNVFQHICTMDHMYIIWGSSDPSSGLFGNDRFLIQIPSCFSPMRIQSEAWYTAQLKTVKQSTWHVTWWPGNCPQEASQYSLDMLSTQSTMKYNHGTRCSCSKL